MWLSKFGASATVTSPSSPSFQTFGSVNGGPTGPGAAPSLAQDDAAQRAAATVNATLRTAREGDDETTRYEELNSSDSEQDGVDSGLTISAAAKTKSFVDGIDAPKVDEHDAPSDMQAQRSTSNSHSDSGAESVVLGYTASDVGPFHRSRSGAAGGSGIFRALPLGVGHAVSSASALRQTPPAGPVSASGPGTPSSMTPRSASGLRGAVSSSQPLQTPRSGPPVITTAPGFAIASGEVTAASAPEQHERGANSDSTSARPATGFEATAPNATKAGALVVFGRAASSQQIAPRHNRGPQSLSSPTTPMCPSAINMPPPTMNVVVLGAPQVGKSSFINAYRTAVMHSARWPVAPVGICGKHGTTSVAGYPNSVTRPSWLLIDTPGRIYENLDDDTSDDAVYLAQLFAGVEDKTRILGRGGIRVTELPPQPRNAVHHAVIVVSAVDLVRDRGKLRLWGRYEVDNEAADKVVGQLTELIHTVRDLLSDTSPFVAVTHMDVLCSQSWSSHCRTMIIALLRRCVPEDCIFFVGMPSAAATASALNHTGGTTTSGSGMHLDDASRGQLIVLHQRLVTDVAWKMRSQQQQLQPRQSLLLPAATTRESAV